MGRPDIKVRRVKRRPKQPEPTDAEKEARKRAEELTASGMPFHMALSVAQGRMELNDALERMAQRAEVERLMRDHELTRALATQVALGHADLDAYLAKRRFERHRADNLDRSCLEPGEGVWTFGLFGGERVAAEVTANTMYLATLQPAEGDPIEQHKLGFKYAYRPDDYKRVKKGVRHHKELTAEPQRPAERPQDRYTCSDKRLFRYLDGGVTVDATLLEGEILRGELAWFGRFEFGLRMKGDAEMVVFRHALHRISEAR